MSNPKAGIQLGSVSMKNYKTYNGIASVEMSLDPQKTITVVQGKAGRGKTTLLGAIYWCLYGTPKVKSSSEADEGIMNNDVLKRMGTGDSDEVYVEVSMYEKGEVRYKIKRTLKFAKKGEAAEMKRHAAWGKLPGGMETEEDIEYSELMKNGNWDVSVDQSAVNARIKTLFPESLSSYFLFDAELLDNFFVYKNQNRVKEGIEKIAGLTLLDDAAKHLNKAYLSITNKIKSVDVEPLRNQNFHVGKAIDEHAQKLESAVEEIAVIDSEREEIESFLRNHNEVVIRKIQEQRDSLEETMTYIKNQMSDHDKEMNDWLLRSNTIAALGDSMADSMKMCDGWEKEGKIPIAVSSLALRNILSGNPPRCICGSDLGKKTDGRKNIEKLLSTNIIESAVIQNITAGREYWGDMIDEIGLLEKNLQEHRSRRSKLIRSYDEIREKLKECEEQLKGHDGNEVKSKSLRLQELNKRREELSRIKHLNDEKIKVLKLEQSSVVRDLNNAIKKENRYKTEYNKSVVANRLKSIIEQCKEDLAEEMKDKVSAKTTEYFLKLAPRKEDFSRVDVNASYRISARGRDEMIKDLSAGQRCCLALSYIAAIRDVAKKNYFMMIDSPLHNIDQAERVDIARNLPEFLPGTQITLLMQDQEYLGEVKKHKIQSVRKTFQDGKSLWGEYLLEDVEGATGTNTEIRRGSVDD